LRSFLLAALKNHLASDWRKATALKRGGGLLPVSFDRIRAEQRLAGEPADRRSPDALYDRNWAHTVLEAAIARLREYYAGLGNEALFAEIEGCLSWNEKERPYAEIASRLGLTEAAVRFAVHRLRKRYQSLLRQRIIDTVATHEDAELEVAHLCEVLALG
jgi:RNA polymerase sigma-70 factor (ECF subfamily)